MKKCPSCGADQIDSVKFCTKCGATLASGAPAAEAFSSAPAPEEPAGNAAFAQEPPQEASYERQPPQSAPYNQKPPQGAPYNQQPPQGAPYNQQPPQGAPYGQQPPQGGPYAYGQQPAYTGAYGYAYTPPTPTPARVPTEEDVKKPARTAAIIYAVFSLLALLLVAVLLFVPMIPGFYRLSVMFNDGIEIPGELEEFKDHVENGDYVEDFLDSAYDDGITNLTVADAKTVGNIAAKRNLAGIDLLRLFGILQKVAWAFGSRAAEYYIVITVIFWILVTSAALIFLTLLFGLLAVIAKNKVLAVFYLIFTILSPIPLDIIAGILVLSRISNYQTLKAQRRAAGLG